MKKRPEKETPKMEKKEHDKMMKDMKKGGKKKC